MRQVDYHSDYHSDSDYFSRSDLVLFAQSRRGFKRKIDRKALDKAEGRKPKDEDADVLRIGKGTHAVALKDAVELSKVRLIPESALSPVGKRQGNAWTKFRLRSDNQGKTLMLPAQWELCQRIADALHRVNIAETDDGKEIKLLDLVDNPKVEREVEYRWADVLPCRLKADIVLELPGYVLCIDLKTAFSVDDRKFRKEIRDRKLWLQVAHYSAGLAHKYQKPVRFVFLAIEKTGDHDAAIFELDPETVEIAKAGRLQILAQLKECLETGAFVDPPRQSGVKVVSLTAADMGIAVV